jgi:hypothetical protein
MTKRSAGRDVPSVGLTLQAPWAALVAWGGRDVENRTGAVARAIKQYRGRVALTASAEHRHTLDGHRESIWQGRGSNRRIRDSVARDVLATLSACEALGEWDKTLDDVVGLAGTWFATATIADVLEPGRNNGPWSMPDQYGIVLADITVHDHFESATGAQGFFAFARCRLCSRPCAVGSRHGCGGAR